jgi:hypothetical protein
MKIPLQAFRQWQRAPLLLLPAKRIRCAQFPAFTSDHPTKVKVIMSNKHPIATCPSLLLAIILATPVLLASQAWAAEPAARVVKVQGAVEVRDAQGQTRGAQVGTALNVGDSLHASANGMAAMQSAAGDIFVIDAGARLSIKDERNTFEHLLGKVLYLFRSKKIVERKVTVQSVTIGIRGTTFLVDADAGKTAIGLKEGALEIGTTGAGFNVYRSKTQEEFEAYKREGRESIKRERAEFERYRSQVGEEFVAFQKTVQLKEQQSLTIAGDKATIGGINDTTTDSIRKLDSFASDL